MVSSTSEITVGGVHRPMGTKAWAALSLLKLQPGCSNMSNPNWPSSSLSSDWEALRVTSLGFLGSCVDWDLDALALLAVHRGLGLAEPAGEAAVVSEAEEEECASSLAG